MDPAYAYETRTKDGVAASTLAPTVAFVRTPGVDGVKPFMSTNRSQKIGDEFFNDQLTDDVLRALEGTPKTTRGSRTKPSVMRYPDEIGTGEVPHVMQFKVYWRWENKDVAEKAKKAKEETKKTIDNLRTMSGLIRQDILTKEMVEQSGLGDEQISALKELANNSEILKIVDPSLNDTLANLLTNNPKQAKLVLEETIKSYQTRLGNIEQEISDGIGKMGVDDMERLLISNRLSENSARSDTILGVGTAAGVVGGAAIGGGAATVASALLSSSGPGLGTILTGAALGGLAGGVLAKMYQTQAVYDQMVSIYLPFCTKINNEDSFSYEDSSQAKMGGAGDLMSAITSVDGIKSSANQLVTLGMEAGAQKAGVAGSGTALTGTVLNPRLEKLFKQKEFRSFNFSWEFYPKNKTEVEQVREIIEAFRYHAHPAMFETDGKEQKVQIQLRVPAEFEIRFLSTNPDPSASGFVENEYIPRIGRCALTSISVDYTPNAIYSSFMDNSPTAMTLTMQFSEMGLMTREVVDRGF